MKKELAAHKMCDFHIEVAQHLKRASEQSGEFPNVSAFNLMHTAAISLGLHVASHEPTTVVVLARYCTFLLS